MKKRIIDEQAVRILREAESRQEPIREVCWRHSITEQPLFRWREAFGGMGMSEAKLLKALDRIYLNAATACTSCRAWASRLTAAAAPSSTSAAFCCVAWSICPIAARIC